MRARMRAAGRAGGWAGRAGRAGGKHFEKNTFLLNPYFIIFATIWARIPKEGHILMAINHIFVKQILNLAIL